jgi:hypothetical protein
MNTFCVHIRFLSIGWAFRNLDKTADITKYHKFSQHDPEILGGLAAFKEQSGPI